MMKKIVENYTAKDITTMPVERGLQVNNKKLKNTKNYNSFVRSMQEKYPAMQKNPNLLLPIT